MKKYITGIYYSLPIQLFLLHTKKYQPLLLFWYILFATVSGDFMHMFGANSLFLAPEYLGEVSPLGTAIVGFAFAMFIIAWNITTFVLHSRHILFLATTKQPFLKYFVNNGIIPISFLIYYLYYLIDYGLHNELLSIGHILLLICGFLGGFMLSVFIAFTYFFGADKSIYRFMAPTMKTEMERYLENVQKNPLLKRQKYTLRIDWFLSANLHLRKPRDVRHYDQAFLDRIFKRHHFAALLSIILAFLALAAIGYFSDDRIFQIPAAASITLLFAVLVTVTGALSYFLNNWGILLLVFIYISVNFLFQRDIIDLRNRAYGLNYNNLPERPFYDREHIMSLCTTDQINQDKNNFIPILNNWKNHQSTPKPYFIIINTSGGGTRSATFTMNVLQRLDELSNGNFMRKVFMINGASGGMIGAAYFRELYAEKLNNNNINLQDHKYVESISKDLLNPIFSSFITRDLASPARYFKVGNYSYVKDRAYAFEEKLNENTQYLLSKSLKDYVIKEAQAQIPMMLFNAVITRDGRQLIIGTQPMTFLMRRIYDSTNLYQPDADAIDFLSLFKNQDPYNLRILTAIRMNATFPYVLPNVWLPSNPIIDVMDAGLRDNLGQETSIRFLQVFKNWIAENTSGVLLIQIRDRPMSEWQTSSTANSILQPLLTPFLTIQKNWFKMQGYFENNELSYWQNVVGPTLQRFNFEYIPTNKNAQASLSFHLTAAEKADIKAALDNPTNTATFQKLIPFLK